MLILENGGRLWNEGGKLVNQGEILLYDNSSLYNGGKYTAVYGGSIERSDFNYYDGFHGAIDGIPLKQQKMLVVVEDEYQLRDMIEYGKLLGVESMITTSGDGFEITEDLVIPKKNVVWLGETVIRDATVTIQGYMNCLFSTLTNEGSIIVAKGGSMDVTESVYTGAAPVNQGGIIWSNVTDISLFNGETPLEVPVSDTAGMEIPLYIDGINPMSFVTWSSSNKKVIDPANIYYDEVLGSYILRGAYPGTTVLTATTLASGAPGEPLSASVTITVEPELADNLKLYMDPAYPEHVETLEMKKEAAAQTFTIYPAAVTAGGGMIPQSKSSIKWTSSDRKLAAVTVNADGSATVTVPANAFGMVTLTAQLANQKEIVATTVLDIRDYSPRLVSNKLTLNPAQNVGVKIGLVPSYDNEIVSVALDNENFAVEYDMDQNNLTIRTIAADLMKNGNVKTTLTVTCTDGNSYDSYEYPLTITVRQVIPAVTVKQNGKMDMFFTDSEAELLVTAKNAVVEQIVLTDTEDFCLKGGMLAFTDSFITNYCNNAKYKPDTTATVLVYLEGYSHPVEKTLKISTMASKLTLVTDPGASVLNLALSNCTTVWLRIMDKKTGEVVIPDGYVECASDFEVNDDTFAIDLGENPEAQTITLNIQQSNWTRSVAVTHKVTVDTKMPTVKFAKATLNLSNQFRNQMDMTGVILSQGNVSFGGFRAFTTNAAEGKKLNVWYDLETGGVFASVKYGQTPKAGTYSFTATPYVINAKGEEIDLKAVTIRVKVASAVPTLKLSTTKVKLNTDLCGKEVAEIGLTLQNKTGYDAWISRFLILNEYKNMELVYEYGMLKAKLTGEVPNGNYTYTLVPVVQDDVGSQMQLKEIKLTVQVYEGNVSITQSGKGKLDSANANSSIVYTISKITNALGQVTKVELIGDDSDRFEISELGVNAKGQQVFELKRRVEYGVSLSETYQVQFRYTICGTTYDSAVQKIKFTQSALKVTAPVAQYYLSQTAPMSVELAVATPAGAQMGLIAVNKATSKELIAALGVMEGEYLYENWKGFESRILELDVWDKSTLVAGKTYKLALDITPVGNADGAKTNTVTVSVKINK